MDYVDARYSSMRENEEMKGQIHRLDTKQANLNNNNNESENEKQTGNLIKLQHITSSSSNAL